MDLSNLMQMANQLREQLQSAQAEATKARFDGEAGGGMVRVVMNGRHELVQVKLDPAALGNSMDDESIRLLEDLIRAAVNQASSQVATGLQDKLGNVAQGLGLDLSQLNIPGLDGLGGPPDGSGGNTPGGGTGDGSA